MKWNVTYDPELNIIHSVFAGCVPVDAFRKGTVKVISLAKKYKTKAVLIDSSKLESSGSIVDIYELPQLYDELKGNRASKIALIFPPSGRIRKDAKFYVTVCQNCGWNVKGFEVHQEALNWVVS